VPTTDQFDGRQRVCRALTTKGESVDKAERLALFARTEVAYNRAEQAKQRAALLARRVKPFTDAMERAEKLIGHEIDLDRPEDARLVGQLLRASGAPEICWQDLGAAAEALEEVRARDEEAAAALREVARYWGGRDGSTLGEWVGCTPAELRAAVERELIDQN
jgi:hypothetical protein